MSNAQHQVVLPLKNQTFIGPGARLSSRPQAPGSSPPQVCTSGVEAAAVATKSAEERVAGKSSEREDLMEKAAAARREIDAAKAAEKKAAEAGD